MHLRDDLAEPHRFGKERGVLVVHHRAAFNRIRLPDQLRVGVEVAQRGQRKRPSLGAVVEEALHEHQRRCRLVAGFPHGAAEHGSEVGEAGRLERIGHLELLGRTGLDAAQVLQEDRITDFEGRVALLDAEVADRGQAAAVEPLRIRAGEAQHATCCLEDTLRTNGVEQPLDVCVVAHCVVQHDGVARLRPGDHEFGHTLSDRITGGADAERERVPRGQRICERDCGEGMQQHRRLLADHRGVDDLGGPDRATLRATPALLCDVRAESRLASDEVMRAEQSVRRSLCVVMMPVDPA